MDPMAAGLRYRVRRAARQIGEQHRHIESLLREFDEALADGSRGELAPLLERYRSALDAHFGLEDEVFFPALHGLHPEQAQELEALSLEHREFEEALEQLTGALESGDGLGVFERIFRSLVEQMKQHEEREERLARALAAH